MARSQVTYLGVGTVSFGSASAQIYPTYPAGLSNNDLVILQVSLRNTTMVPTVSASWQTLAAADSDLTSRQYLYWRFATAGLSLTSSTIGTSATACKGARIYGFSGNKTDGTPWEAGAFTASTTGTIAAAQATTTVSGCMGVSAIFVSDDNSVTSFTGEAGGDWTKQTQASTTLGSDLAIAWQIATCTATTTITGGVCSMNASDPWGCRSFVILSTATAAIMATIPQFMDYYMRYRS